MLDADVLRCEVRLRDEADDGTYLGFLPPSWVPVFAAPLRGPLGAALTAAPRLSICSAVLLCSYRVTALYYAWCVECPALSQRPAKQKNLPRYLVGYLLPPA